MQLDTNSGIYHIAILLALSLPLTQTLALLLILFPLIKQG